MVTGLAVALGVGGGDGAEIRADDGASRVCRFFGGRDHRIHRWCSQDAYFAMLGCGLGFIAASVLGFMVIALGGCWDWVVCICD